MDREGPPRNGAPQAFAGLGAAQETTDDGKKVSQKSPRVNPTTAKLWFAAMRAVVLGQVTLNELFDTGAQFTMALAACKSPEVQS